MWGGNYHGYEQARGGAEWIMNRSKIPVAEYQDTAKNFNPVNYNPDEWVKMAKNAGMKYIIITSKHHDGFALFESEASPWNVVDTTKYGKDLLKPLAEACKKYGVKLGFYYSQAQDWNNPGGTVARKLMKEGWPNPDSTQINNYTEAHKGHWDPAQETINGNTILYFSVFNWPENGTLKIPGIKNQIVSATLLKNNKKLKYQQEKDEVILNLPKKAPDKIVSVIKVEFKGKRIE